MTDKERLEEIIDAIAYLRDEYVDTEMVSEYYGHDIKAEIFSCPISALSYTGDYIELLQKRVQELERKIKRYREALEFYADEETYETKFATDTDEIYDPFTLIDFFTLVELDGGEKARQALEGEK